MLKIILAFVGGSSIRQKVMAKISARIKKAEAEYANGVKEIECEAERAKSALESRLVEELTTFIK